MKPREVVIGIALETNETITNLKRKYLACICDRLTMDGKYGRIRKVTVFNVKKITKAKSGEGQ